MTQQEICNSLLPTIQSSPIYEKFGVFEYRIPGERIVTTIDGKLETTQFAKCHDKIVMTGPAGESYLIGIHYFNDRYQIIDPAGDQGQSFGKALALGSINAIRVTTENFVDSFIAKWREEMFPTIGGFYACPVGGNEVYFIDEAVFSKTYKLKDA